MDRKYYAVVPLAAILFLAVFFVGINVGYQRSTGLGLGFYLNPPPGDRHEALGVHIDAYYTNGKTLEVTYLGHHAGVMTTIGFDAVQDAIFDNGTAAPGDAIYMALSNSTDTPNSTWTQIPDEIETGGLARIGGAYARTSATVCTIAKQWTASATNNGVQLVGFHWSATPGADNTLMWSDTFSSVNLNSGDKLTVTATITLS